jgi:hypothetical protein
LPWAARTRIDETAVIDSTGIFWMRVEADAGIGVSAKTVGELRKVTTWSENLVITTPQERHPESAVKISKATVATRTSPKR